jgi:mono/diheme cytochrome c family protein
MGNAFFRALRLAAAALAVGAGAFWLASASRLHAQSAAEFNWRVLGQQTYNNNCSGCHQSSGKGIPGGFPPLAGHAPEVLTQEGHAYLVRLVLFGLAGAIEVDGTSYSGNMPSWSDSLRDDEIAAVINQVLTDWGNDALLPKEFQPVLPAEVAAARAENLTPQQVYGLRQMSATQEAKPQTIAKTTADTGRQTSPSFTLEQAERGHLAYAHNCLDCHGSNLDNGEFGGPPLKGTSFGRHWSGGSVAALLAFMRAKMPPDRPGELNEETYADLAAFILAENGYPPGDKELPADMNAQQAMSLAR